MMKNQKIKIIGIGGGGQNIVDYISEHNESSNIETFVINSDEQVLEIAKTKNKILMGAESFYKKFILLLSDKFGKDSKIVIFFKKLQVRKSLGCGGDVEEGKKLTEKYLHKVKFITEETDLIILFSCFGGGFGTGATQVIAKFLKETPNKIVAVVVIPFEFECQKRTEIAQEGLKELTGISEDYIVLYNNDFIQDMNIPLKAAFDVISKAILENIFKYIEN